MGFPWTLAGPELLCLFILAEAEVRDVVMCQVWETHHNSELHRESLSLTRLAGIIISVKKKKKVCTYMCVHISVCVCFCVCESSNSLENGACVTVTGLQRDLGQHAHT